MPHFCAGTDGYGQRQNAKDEGESRLGVSCTNSASPSKPLRMSV
jgi:hypothetical protein